MYITNENELLERIKKIIQIFAKGKCAPFARKIGVNERYVTKYIKEKRGDWFMGYIKDICEAYPTLSEHWMYTGEGEMLVPARPNPIRSITNAQDLLIGDLLWEFFRFKNLFPEDVIAQCGFDETFNQVMESSRYPTFTELEALYNTYNFNVGYLFNHKKEEAERKKTSRELRRLADALEQSEKENKLLNSRLLNALEENSELNKELRNQAEKNSQAKLDQKEAGSAFGKTSAEITKRTDTLKNND